MQPVSPTDRCQSQRNPSYQVRLKLAVEVPCVVLCDCGCHSGMSLTQHASQHKRILIVQPCCRQVQLLEHPGQARCGAAGRKCKRGRHCVGTRHWTTSASRARHDQVKPRHGASKRVCIDAAIEVHEQSEGDDYCLGNEASKGAEANARAAGNKKRKQALQAARAALAPTGTSGRVRHRHFANVCAWMQAPTCLHATAFTCRLPHILYKRIRIAARRTRRDRRQCEGAHSTPPAPCRKLSPSREEASCRASA